MSTNLKNKIIGLHWLLLMMIVKVNAQPSLAWQYQYNGQGDYTDRFTCITSDGAGNIYSGGSTVNIGTDRDYLIQKADASGNVVWRTMYNASGNGPDEVLAIAVDASQNVYVTGFGKSSDVGNDFLTIKMNSSGQVLWKQFYNDDAANGYDQANSIILDGSGNVIVTGQSDADATAFTNDDYLTIKYSNDGNVQWVMRYNGLGNGIDRAVKAVVDNADNIYVTGRSFNGSDDDYATIKYNSAGVQQWLHYGDRTHHDRAEDMTIDASANIYVTGWSSNGTNHDFYTIKYNSAGTQLWAKVFDNVDDDEASAIFVTSDGSVYITGKSDADASAFVNYNFRTVKYNSSGLQQWSATYDGTAGNDDIPTAISVTGGSVIVTGYSDADVTPVISYNISTVAYTSSGSQMWAAVYSGSGSHDDVGNAMLTDANGNVYVAGYSENEQAQADALTIKYNSNGSQIFATAFNGTGDNSDNVRDIQIDAQGNLYLAGYTVKRQLNRNMLSIKLNPQGDSVWTKFIDGSTPGSEDESQACSIDNSGNIIISGFTKNSGTSGDFTTVKMDAATGDSLWLRYYDSPSHEYDKVYDMQTDASGNIYLTGRSDSDPSINSNDDAATIKYSAAGLLLWQKTYAGVGNGSDRGNFLRIAASGNVYVGGRTFNGTDDNILLIKYDNNGIQQWVKTYDGGVGNEDLKGIVMDGNENIYLAVNSASAGGDTSDIVTIKYAPSGELLWEKRINKGGGDEANDVTIDQSGNVIVTGTSDEDNSPTINLNAITVKYDVDGNEVWLKSFDGVSHADDIADAIVCDQFGNVYEALHTNNGTAPDLNYDIQLIRYNSDGAVYWQTSFTGSSDTLDAANLLYFINNDLYVAGSTWQSNGQRDILILKYAAVTGVEGVAFQDQSVSVYPNPVADFLNISTDNSGSEKQLQLFDLNGKLVLEKTFTQSSIQIPVAGHFAQGMYLCNILSHNTIIHSQKIIFQP